MKLFKKVLAGVAVAAAMATSAYASPITVGGVTWDPDSAFDFTAKFDFSQWFVGLTLTGVGEVYKLNNTNPDVFVPNGELTLHFGGFTQDGLGGFTNGWLNVYYGTGVFDNFDAGTTPYDVAKATDGTLWLSLVATSNQFVADNPNAANPYLSGQLTANWNVVPNVGSAWSNLDTNGQALGTDVFSRASATFNLVDPSLGIVATNGPNGNLVSNSIPEPESLALVGLGLLGLAAARRRKSTKAAV